MIIITQGGEKLNVHPEQGFSVNVSERAKGGLAVVTLKYDKSDSGFEIGRFPSKFRALSVAHMLFAKLYNMDGKYRIPHNKPETESNALLSV